MARIVLFFLLLVFSSVFSLAHADKLRIVVTIKPLYLLVNEVAGAHADTRLLIPDTVSVHDYNFRPSDLRKLNKADAVVRMAPHLEVFLNPLLKDRKMVISLGDAPGVRWLPMRHAHDHTGLVDAHEHSSQGPCRHNHSGQTDTAHDSHHDNHDEAKHAEEQAPEQGMSADLKKDPHIWLAPENAEAMVLYLTQQLGKLDAAHAENYRQNGARLIAKIREVDKSNRTILQAAKGIPYLVFHDGWRYFEHAYGLAEPEVVSLHEGLPPGSKTIQHLRDQIAGRNIRCLVTSPNNNQAIMSALTEGTKVQPYYLSPIGTGLEVSGFAEFMQHNAKQFARCLLGDAHVR